ncbi:hypothetical protein SPI_01646 [Niveomyces insectorum RCEF 264]|uniref:Rhodopsin domain-containing protein n=1 Tax=Niveomyces insectorum RCEF 264 TaxID=1081102 RepID=A0A162MUA8_9HYPO|nr:hypothetical protein SPI_01646 [Niveomyces insectorum RCEF 264]
MAFGFLIIPPGPTSGLQTFALFINFFFPALALTVVTARAAGRLVAHQFGLVIKTNFIGIHLSQVPPHDPTQSLIWTYAVEILYNPILALVKSSVLVFLLRLFGQRTGVRRFIIGLNTINLVQMTGVFFAVLFQCLPIDFNWDKSIKGGHCVEQRILFTATGAFNIFTDIVVLALPLYILVGLKIPRRTKIGLIFIFLLGFLVTISSVARLIILVQGQFNLVVLKDPTFNIGFVTSAIETNLALITASVPALRPFLRRRNHGGWLPTFGRSRQPDTELARNTTYMSRASTLTVAAAKKPPSSPGRGSGQRGGRTGSRRTGRRDIRIQTERALRSQSPRSSEEEAMTNDGIVRISDLQREIDGLTRELTAVSGGGFTSFLDTDPAGSLADRYYDEGADPVSEYRGERNFNEERLSRYGDRRFGVITPKSMPPQWPGNPDGQPF